MSIRCRPSWAIVGLLGVAIAACGESGKPDRFDLKTPRVEAPAAPAPTVTPAATPEATPDPRPVSAAERRVIRGWSDKLRHGDVDAAARYFSVPSRVSNADPGWVLLETSKEVQAFNRGLPCGAKLIKTRRSVERFVVGVFELTDRPGGECGTGTGTRAAVAFLIREGHITSWIRVDEGATPTPTPAAPGSSAPASA